MKPSSKHVDPDDETWRYVPVIATLFHNDEQLPAAKVAESAVKAPNI